MHIDMFALPKISHSLERIYCNAILYYFLCARYS